ncbi:cytochrome P450 [Apiospora arundinis]
MSSASLDLAYPFARLPFAASAAIIGVLSVLYLAYQWALPKPLPGIPYNQDAVKTILGDAVEIQRIKKEGGRPRAWFNLQPERHNSPLVQAFLAPLSKPVLILSDFRESQDILLRRAKEFDRGPRHVDNFSGLVPWHHIAMKTSDPQFKANRELVKDLMTPHFLNTVSGPEIYNNAQNFIQLWKLKAQLAGGRPFKAEDDLHTMTFDIIKVVALGEGDNQSMTALYLDLVRSTAANAQSASAGQDEPFVFPENMPNLDLRAHGTQQEAVGAAATQPFPGLFHKFNNRKPHMKEAFAAKFSMLDRQVSLGVKRMEAGAEVKSALDYMMQRELASAKKAGRAPVFNSPSMYDELYGYIGAGHETSSTSLQWGLKHLAADQRVQTTLRSSLRAAYADAVSEGRQPTFTEIIKTQVPYLDAVVEEILRVSGPVKTLFRTAVVDTTILGHHIPKGTQIFLPVTGPSFTAPAFTIEESLRSPSCQSHKSNMRSAWDESNAASFVPERWLQTEEAGTQAFDSQAGPMLAFSLGIRGCFGRRLAYLQLRILMTLIVWNFEFGPLPEELNSFDAVDTLTTKPVKCFVRLAEAH